MASNANLIVNIGANTTGFTGGINQVTQQSQQLSQTLSKIGAAVAAAFAADKIISFAKEASELAQVAEGVEIAFKRIGGDQIMGQLQKATKGTVSDLELMKAAVQASNFKIPLQDLSKLLEFAHQRAKDTGQSVDYLVQSIVLGIGRKSPLILDNLGISAVALREKFHGLNAEQKTVADVAKAVGEIAAEEMAKVGDSVQTASEKFAQQKAIIENWKVDIGKAVNGIVGLFTSLVAVLDDTINRMATIISSKNLSGWEKFLSMLDSKKFEKVSDELNALQKTATINADAWLGKVTNHLKTFEGDAEKAMQFLKDKRSELVSQLGEFESLPLNQKDWPDAYKVAFSEIQIEYNRLNEMINNPKGIDDMLFPEGVDKVTSDIEKVGDKLDWLSEWGKGGQMGAKPVEGTDEDRMMKGLFGDSMQTIGGLGLTGDTKSGVKQLEEYATAYKNVAETVSEAAIEMSGAMSQFAEEFAVGIGDLMSGAASFSDFGDVIIKAVANFMKSLGSQLIALGMAGIAAKMLATNPYAALAAGIALVALSSAASSALSGNPMSGGGARSVSSGSYSGMQSNKDMKLEIIGMVKGTDIYWSQKRLEKQLNNTTVRSGR